VHLCMYLPMYVYRPTSSCFHWSLKQGLLCRLVISQTPFHWNSRAWKTRFSSGLTNFQGAHRSANCMWLPEFHASTISSKFAQAANVSPTKSLERKYSQHAKPSTVAGKHAILQARGAVAANVRYVKAWATVPALDWRRLYMYSVLNMALSI